MQQLGFGGLQIRVLLFQKREAFFEFVVFLDRLDIHRPHRFELRVEFLDEALDKIPVRAVAAGCLLWLGLSHRIFLRFVRPA